MSTTTTPTVQNSGGYNGQNGNGAMDLENGRNQKAKFPLNLILCCAVLRSIDNENHVKLLMLLYRFSFECIGCKCVHRFVAFSPWDEIKNIYTHTYTHICSKPYSSTHSHSYTHTSKQTNKQTARKRERKSEKTTKKRKKIVTNGQNDIHVNSIRDKFRKQCVFCNRTFHPKRINGEPLIKLCSICVQISTFSNTRRSIE